VFSSVTLPVLLTGTRLWASCAFGRARLVPMSRTIVGQVAVARRRRGLCRLARRARSGSACSEWRSHGLAGLFEVAGLVGQLVPVISPGYGYRDHRGLRPPAPQAC
jgi:simple sugar transport system permease protein